MLSFVHVVFVVISPDTVTTCAFAAMKLMAARQLSNNFLMIDCILVCDEKLSTKVEAPLYRWIEEKLLLKH